MESSNVKTMREALESVRNWCLNRLVNSSYQVTVEGLLSVVNAALTKPPRNCDRPECATTNAAQDVWSKEDGGKTAYYEWLLATSTKEETNEASNVKAMREALEKVRRVLHCAIVADILKGDDVSSAFNEVTAALSAPPRNCDVGTAEEQARRYEELCDSHTCGSICSRSGCPLYDYDCSPFAWAQMPYEGGDVK